MRQVVLWLRLPDSGSALAVHGQPVEGEAAGGVAHAAARRYVAHRQHLGGRPGVFMLPREVMCAKQVAAGRQQVACRRWQRLSKDEAMIYVLTPVRPAYWREHVQTETVRACATQAAPWVSVQTAGPSVLLIGSWVRDEVAGTQPHNEAAKLAGYHRLQWHQLPAMHTAQSTGAPHYVGCSCFSHSLACLRTGWQQKAGSGRRQRVSRCQAAVPASWLAHLIQGHMALVH